MVWEIIYLYESWERVRSMMHQWWWIMKGIALSRQPRVHDRWTDEPTIILSAQMLMVLVAAGLQNPSWWMSARHQEWLWNSQQGTTSSQQRTSVFRLIMSLLLLSSCSYYYLQQKCVPGLCIPTTSRFRKEGTLNSTYLSTTPVLNR